MPNPESCVVCGTTFQPRFAFQVQKTQEGVLHFCSQACHEKYLFSSQQRTCGVCGKSFVLEFAYQQLQLEGETRYFCSTECREQALAEIEKKQKRTHRIAVLNQKGGTGKTTTSVNVAAGLAQQGKRVLLIDLDSQGNVAVSLGLSAPHTIYDLLIDGVNPLDCIVNVSENLDAIISNTSLAGAEPRLLASRERYKVLTLRMAQVTDYDYVLIDCGPSISMLNQNALTYADSILIPVSCDYLSLVGVKQILRTVKKVNELLLEPVEVLGVVPTFYDRTLIAREAITTLQAYFKDRVLPPIRANIKIKEAPSHKQTIFEYAPGSTGCADYLALVERIQEIYDSAAEQ